MIVFLCDLILLCLPESSDFWWWEQGDPGWVRESLAGVTWKKIFKDG